MVPAATATCSYAQNGSRHQPHGRPECERVSVLASWFSDDLGELCYPMASSSPPRCPLRACAPQERRGCGVVAVTVLREPASQLKSDFDYFERDNLTLTEYARMTHSSSRLADYSIVAPTASFAASATLLLTRLRRPTLLLLFTGTRSSTLRCSYARSS